MVGILCGNPLGLGPIVIPVFYGQNDNIYRKIMHIKGGVEVRTLITVFDLTISIFLSIELRFVNSILILMSRFRKYN